MGEPVPVFYFHTMTKVLFVCLGNICRSPMAHGIFRAKVEALNLEDQFEIDSAGTSGWHAGEAPNKRAQLNMLEHGIDISDLRSRKFRQLDFETFDYIFTMDESNYNNVIELTENSADKSKVSLMLEQTHPGEKRSVPDPYYGGELGFENVYQMLDAACDVVINKLK